MKITIMITLGLIFIPLLAVSKSGSRQEELSAAVVKNNTEGPRVLAEGGLTSLLEKMGFSIRSMDTVALSPAEQQEYGDWNRDALESRSIGQLVAKNRRGDGLIIGLLTNCTDLMGMLAGLQHLRPAGAAPADERSLQREGLVGLKPLRVGLIYFDAHADFNTPETTLSGMLGGMDVAWAAGLCLDRLRIKTGLDPALPTRYIVFGCLRDVDPLEQELLDRSNAEYLSVDDVRNLSDNIDIQMDRLNRLTDVIYVHVDMDVLDPSEVRGHPLTAPEGPLSGELAAAIQKIFRHPKSSAIGIASLPFGDRDPDKISLKAAYRLIEGAVKGILDR